MAKRDPEKTARNRLIKELTEELKDLLPSVLKETGIKSVYSINGLFGGKFADYIDIKNEVIHSPEHFISLYLSGFKEMAKKKPYSAHNRNFKLLQSSPKLQRYIYLFLKRTYLRNYEALSKKRPKVEDAAIWIGQNNAHYGLLVTPRFNVQKSQWENDKSEIRHFKPLYWSIGHIIETGLVIPGKNERINFSSVDEYLNFFLNVIVRNSGSNYEYELAALYRDYVLDSPVPENIPLLIPEFRYGGLNFKHLYRLDFTIIDPIDLNKIGFELSPWSSHGYIAKTQGLSQREINKIAKYNFEKEMKKHKAFFRKYGIFVLIYTDSDLANLNKIFDDMRRFLEPKTRKSTLQFQIMQDILSGNL